jgi:hypothetical protein
MKVPLAGRLLNPRRPAQMTGGLQSWLDEGSVASHRLLLRSRSSFFLSPQGETAPNLDLMLLIEKQFLETPFYCLRQMACSAP